MNKMYLVVRDVEGKGRGIFAAKAFRRGELLDVCPVLVFSPKERELLDQTLLHDYVFVWGEDDSQSALALGYGSLFNHSSSPNARYLADYENGTLEIHAYRDIAAGEEICFNYNGDPEDKDLVWFEK